MALREAQDTKSDHMTDSAKEVKYNCEYCWKF